MLHILWLILKFILIILGILLGLLLLAVLLVLFCPVRYKASAVKTEGELKQIEGEGIVSWLFHAVSLKVGWKDQQLSLIFYLFGIPIDRLLKKHRNRKAGLQKKSRKKEKTSGTDEKTKINSKVLNENPVDSAEGKRDHMQQEDNSAESIQRADEQETEETVSTEISNEIAGKKENFDKTVQQKTFFIKKIYSCLQKIIKNIQKKLHSIYMTLGGIRNRVSWWKEFLEHPRVKAARDLVWKHAKFLLKHIFPTRIEGQITFSCEDPALTGTALAVLGMTIPFHKNCVQITPRFDGENYLQGNIKAKGRIYGFVFVRAALSIYFDKNKKYVIKRWKTRRA